jgi:putative ABC transport system ATP-binding protein
MPTPAFSARGVTKTYRMGEVEVSALEGVDLDLAAGEFVVLLGPSGSGKSTLLNILGGLDVPTAGSVCFRDHDLSAADDALRTAYRRDHVGFVFQFYNLLPGLTALENVAVVAYIARAPMPPAEALSLVGLADRASHFPSQLSGGEQQRVAVARALVHRPALVLADEPTASLDLRAAQAVIDVLQALCAEQGAALLLVSHDPRALDALPARRDLAPEAG